MLYQGSTTTNNGTIKITNMTNCQLSDTAIDAIGSEMLYVEDINAVTVVVQSETEDGVSFYVFESNTNNELFSVDNDGIVSNN